MCTTETGESIVDDEVTYKVLVKSMETKNLL